MDYTEYVVKQGKGDCIEELIKVRKNVISLEFEKCDEENIPIGASKSGGYPDLPPSINIPTLCGYTENRNNRLSHYKESAMQLVAQINLSEISKYDIDNKLPKHGMLYFFWSGEIMLSDSSYCSYSFEGDNRELFKIIYYDGDMSLLRRTKPECNYYSKYFEAPLESKRIVAKECKYMYDSSKLEDIFYDENDEEIAGKLYEAYADWEVCGNKMLGYHTGSMNVSGPIKGYTNLFQFDYHVGCVWDIMWFISEEALSERNFNEVYMDYDMD